MATSVIPIVASGVQAVVGLFSPKETTGLPQIPSSDPTFNRALATKWYTYYFTRHNDNPALVQNGIGYWAEQIRQDGPARAWANFSTSAEPVADGVAAKASALASVYGGPLVLLAPTANVGQSATSPSSAAALPYGVVSATPSTQPVGTVVPTGVAPGAPSPLTLPLEIAAGALLATKVL